MEDLGQYVETRLGIQSAAHHFLFNSCSPANVMVYKDLSAKTWRELELTVALAVC